MMIISTAKDSHLAKDGVRLSSQKRLSDADVSGFRFLGRTADHRLWGLT